VWYDIVYDFGAMAEDGTTGEIHHESEGVYFASWVLRRGEARLNARQRENCQAFGHPAGGVGCQKYR
jgi:hypothetical protein